MFDNSGGLDSKTLGSTTVPFAGYEGIANFDPADAASVVAGRKYALIAQGSEASVAAPANTNDPCRNDRLYGDGGSGTALTNYASNVDLVFSTYVSMDETSPKVSEGSPASSANDVQRSTNVTASFSKEMDANTLSSSTFKLFQWNAKKKQWRQLTDAAVTCNLRCTTATLYPYASDSSKFLAANKKYKAVITTGAQDMAGNALSSKYSWTFTTGSS